MPLPIRLAALLSLLLSSTLLSASAAHAQPTDDVRRVVLTDGTVLVGTVDDETADPVVVRTRDGVEQRVPRARVAEITSLIGGRFTRLDPTRTRALVSPTGRTLGGGRTRIGTLLYVIPNATVGLTDRVDLSGTALISFGGDAGAFLPVLGAKVGLVDTGSLAVAVGTQVAIPVSGGDAAIAVTPYVAATLGSETRSVTLGATGFAGGDLGEGDFQTADGVVLQGSGEVQVSNRLKLLGEILVPAFADEGTDGALVLPGVRLFGDRFSVDVFGFVALGDGGAFGFAPIANFSYTF